MDKFRVLLQADIDEKKLQSTIQAISNKNKIIISAKFEGRSISELEKKFQQIKENVDRNAKIDIFKDAKGNIESASIAYRDGLGAYYKETWRLEKESGQFKLKRLQASENQAQIESKITRELEKQAREEAKIAKENERIATTNKKIIDKKQAREEAKIAKENERIATTNKKIIDSATLYADKFLERTKDLQQTPQVRQGITIAEQIKEMGSKGNVEKVQALSRELKVLDAGIRQAGHGAWSFSEQFKVAIARTIEYSASIGLVYGALRQLREGMQYIVELNKELTNIQVLQVEGAKTAEDIRLLAIGYNALAKELGATTIEVARGSTEWLRQGKTIAETGELLKSTLYLSKLGALDSAQSTEYLTAILNGFQKEASESVDVVNKLVAIDNIAATSAGELATALQYSSAVAKESEVSFENLTAMIATVSSRTRLSAEMIGTAFRTMFVRMQQVTAGEIDETGLSLNNVEKALSAVNVKLRDSTRSFRPLEDVIRDVAEKWDTLDEVQRAQISTAVAGQRQAQIFYTVMQNYGDVEKYVAEQTLSAGLAQDRYAIYLDNVEAAQNRMTTSLEKMWQTTISSDAIKNLYNFVTTIFDIIEAMGGLIPVVGAVVGALISLNSVGVAKFFSDMAKSISATITTMMQLETTAVATGVAINTAFGIIGLAITAISLGWGLLSSTFKSSEEIIANLNTEITALENNISSLKAQADAVKTLAERFEELRDKTGKTKDESKEFRDIQNQLKDIVPTLSGHYDNMGNFLIEAKDATEELNAATKKRIEQEERLLSLKIEASIDERISLFKDQQKAVEESIKTYDYYDKKLKEGALLRESYLNSASDQIEEEKIILEQMSDSFIQDFVKLDEAGQKHLIFMLENSGEAGKALVYILRDMVGKAVEDTTEIIEEQAKIYPLLTENFQKFLELTYKSKDTTNEVFDTFIGGLRDTNRSFQEGLLDAGAYFDQIEQSLKDVNMKEVFGDDLDSAQTFFAGLTENAAESLSYINEQFSNGEISITKYTEQLAQLGDVFGQIGRLAEGFLGPDNAVTQALASMTEGVNQLRQAQELNIIVQNTLREATQENLEFDTEAYRKKMELVAAAAEQSGLVFKDINGRALEGKDQILAYLTEADGNIVKLADQSANQTGKLIEGVVHNIGKMLKVLGEKIGKFDAKINFTPNITGEEKLPGLPGLMGLSLPTFNYDISGNLGKIFEGIGSALEDFNIGDLKLDFTAKIYTQGFDNAEKEMQDLIDTTGSLANAFDTAKDSARDLQALLDMVVSMLRQQKEAQKDALEEELDAYKRIIDARKKMIDQEKEDLDFQRKLEDKQKTAAQIQAEIEELKLDKSEEAKAKRLKLEEELAKLKEQINNDIQDENIEKRKDALDDDYAKFEDIIKAKIDEIDEYLKQPGLIVADAIDLINQHSDQLYQDLMEWNRSYGSGVDADVIGAWNKAYDVLLKYKDMLGQINYQLTQIALLQLPDFPEYPGGYNYQPIPKLYHEGGPVGGLGANEEFAKLMKGEYVLSAAQMDKLMNVRIPNLLTATPTPTGGQGLNIGKLIEINSSGNLDKSILPDIERIARKVVDELNEAMGQRGYNRTANTFSI